MGMLIESDSLRLQQTEIGFTTEIKEGESWRVASLPSLPVYGLHGNQQAVMWTSTFNAEAGGVWVETKLTVTTPTKINPSMILWLGTLDNVDDRQAHTWRNTILRAPTTNQQGMGGNDLPAGYFYDNARHLETIVSVPANAFAWSKHRFYDFELQDVLQYNPVGRYGFGLVAKAPEVTHEFPIGEHTLRWWFIQRPRTTIPTPWEAQQILITTLQPLLDVVPTLYADAPSWNEMATRTLQDLADEACWTTLNGEEGLRAYVRGSSKLARDEANGFEIMTQLDVLMPLLLWQQATGNTHADSVIERLLKTLPLFDRPVESFVANNYPPHKGDTFMDTWYFLENALIKLPWVAYLTNDSALKDMFFSALAGAQQLAANTNYQFPLFADASDWKARQSVLNVGVIGLYAAGCVIASQLQPEKQRFHLDEAAAALRASIQLPPRMHTHEPQQLTFAAAAANYLAQYPANGEDWQQYRTDFVNLSLRMGYWERDSAVDFYDARGMFQACASLCYPAYKENVETLLSWSELLKTNRTGLPVELMAAWMNLQRCHNYAFFDPWLPVEHHAPHGTYIPHENIATHELNHTATFGKELYGAGEVFWSALMFDTYGHSEDPDILCLSLDVPCLELTTMAQRGKQFLLYNPTLAQRTTTLITSNNRLSVTLEPQSVQFISKEV